MKYVLLGHTGVKVSELCLGTMTFGKEADEKRSGAIMSRAVDAGINFFDAANVYSKGRSEEIVGRWLGSRREEIILASKAGGRTGSGMNDRGNSRRNITLAVEKSLKRLQTDWLDVFYLHFWDEEAAIEETLAAMTDLVRQGKVLYCGVSNFAAWQMMKAIGLAQARRYAPIVCTQPMYNLVKRQAEVEILPLAQSEGLAVCPYSPMGAGLLTGKYQQGGTGRLQENAMYKKRYANPEYVEVAERFVQYAASRGLSPAALAIAWVNSHPAVTSAIIGARDLDQLNDTLQCLEVDLDTEARAEITALSIDPPLATDREA